MQVQFERYNATANPDQLIMVEMVAVMDSLDRHFPGHLTSVYRYACYHYLSQHLMFTDRTVFHSAIVRAVVNRYPNPIGLSVKGYSPHAFKQS